MAKHQLMQETVEGEVYWFSDAPPTPAPTELTAYLLPEYDEYILPYRHINITDLPWTLTADSGTDFFYRPILIGGRRVGTWRRSIAKKAITLDVNLAVPLDDARWHALRAAADRYATYMNLPVTIAEFKPGS